MQVRTRSQIEPNGPNQTSDNSRLYQMKREHVANHGSARIGSALAAVALASLIAACSKPSPGPEAEVRSWVERGVAAAEAKERDTILDMISPAYADSRGYNRARVGDLLGVYFLRMSTIELMTSIDEVNVMGDTAAEVLVTVGMAGKHDGLLGFSADAYQFALELEKVSDDWNLISARWGQLGKELK